MIVEILLTEEADEIPPSFLGGYPLGTAIPRHPRSFSASATAPEIGQAVSDPDLPA